MGDKTKEFAFTLALTGTDLPATLTYTKNAIDDTATLTNNQYGFTLGHNDQIVFNIPANLNYAVTEVNDGYAVTMSNNTGIMVEDKDASFTNTLNKTIETGVEDNHTAAILILLLSMSAILITIENRKKRQRKQFGS